MPECLGHRRIEALAQFMLAGGLTGRCSPHGQMTSTDGIHDGPDPIL
jgi:hypothetical protein